MAQAKSSQDKLQAIIESLRFQLEEAEEIIRAIGSGEVDAFVVTGANGVTISKLKGADQFCHALVETMNDGAATLTADGTIFYCNNSLATILQVPMERLIGMQISSFVPPAEQLHLLDLLEKCTQVSIADEINMITSAGDSITVLLSIAAFDLKGNHGLSVVVKDITWHKRTENELSKSIERFKQLAELNRTVNWEVNSQGIYTYLSAVSENVFGYHPDELTGKIHLYDLHPEDGEQSSKKSLLKLLSKRPH